jgi:type II secretory pathway component PulJ
MLSMLLVLSVLGLVATLMREYTRVARHSEARDQTLDGVAFALAEMGHEASGANVLQTPQAGLANELKFLRPDPRVNRYGLLGPDPANPVWEPNASNQIMLVRYTHENGALVREVRRDSQTSRQTLAENVNALVVNKLDDDYLELSMSFQENRRVRSFSMKTKLWSLVAAP